MQKCSPLGTDVFCGCACSLGRKSQCFPGLREATNLDVSGVLFSTVLTRLSSFGLWFCGNIRHIKRLSNLTLENFQMDYSVHFFFVPTNRLTSFQTSRHSPLECMQCSPASEICQFLRCIRSNLLIFVKQNFMAARVDAKFEMAIS